MQFLRNRARLIFGVALVGVIVISMIALLSSRSPKPLTTHSPTTANTQTVANTQITATTSSSDSLVTPTSTATASPTLTPATPTHGTTPPTAKPVPPTNTPVPHPATATPTSSYPQLNVTTPNGDSATCGTATAPGSFPPVVVTNIGGGTLNWFFTFPAEPSSLYFTYKLSATVNGQPAQSDVNHFYLTSGQSATFQLYQNTLAAAAVVRNNKPLSGVPPNDMRIDFWNTDNMNIGIQEMYPCTNY